MGIAELVPDMRKELERHNRNREADEENHRR